jgi:hypothetical protein
MFDRRWIRSFDAGAGLVHCCRGGGGIGMPAGGLGPDVAVTVHPVGHGVVIVTCTVDAGAGRRVGRVSGAEPSSANDADRDVTVASMVAIAAAR